jgi:hypothetical protein
MCPYPECDGDTVLDAWPWDRVRVGHRSYPAKPRIGKRYPLYRTKDNIGAEFEWFRQASSEEGGLIAKAHAALVLGVSKQRIGDLVAEKRLREHEFFGKEFISCRDLEAFRKVERKTGRPKANPERVDDSPSLPQRASREARQRKAA